ncbi:tetratricopeptide repeat protein [Candidatus Methylobacter oryzae]|uniref:Tetratricopeptide repeat protein n=1 Tax=Candidatus Methylobacter oryzae TaxID=2497749 RepID=A0ABY3C754_9GAMM|nr:tetratricopeptide repeat protein [Candidatus Methylobacter oryzae]TRW91482.1 tetratricopeptide repeat protein [Candidatus Methylobacter oryzae]
MKKHLFTLTTSALLSYAMTVQADSAVNVQILSATIKDQKIDNATVILQKNGEQSVTAHTNAQGQAVINSNIGDDSGALLIVKKENFSDLVVKCPCAGMTYAISPVMRNLDGMRVVLNWGENPNDLDSHVVYPNNHVYFEHMKGTDAMLDVDDTSSFGPETITIERKHDGERYIYAVHNYSDRSNPNSNVLSASQAKVFVYVGQTLIKTYYVPQNQAGNLWVVFAVTEAGDIQDFNTIKGVTSEKRLQTEEFQGVANNTSVATVDYSADAKAKAKDLNTKGEQAYHAKNYDEAIRNYKAAIELDGSYGQAYSNLGLAFQKANNVSEALWANRKAIALASGPTAATVRAGTHFNNGRIYEDAKQWDDALREYQYAKTEKSNPVYDKAIARVKKQGAK